MALVADRGFRRNLGTGKSLSFVREHKFPMPFLRPQVFDIAEVPPLDLSRGPLSVDIGYLAYEAHTAAFVAIFEKLLRDNAGTLGECTLTAVRGQHAIANTPPSLSPPVSFGTLAEQSREAALCLYFSKNDEVVLTFAKANITRELLVAFDNPYFRLQ